LDIDCGNSTTYSSYLYILVEIMWFLKNTFGIVTLRIGVISFSSVFIVRKKFLRYYTTISTIKLINIFQTLAACILLVNVLSLDIEEPSTKHLFISVKTQKKTIY